MRRLRIFSILLLTCVVSINAVTVDEILGKIASNNIELKSIEASNKSKIAEIKTSNNLEDTQFEAEYQKGDNINGNKYGFGISQGFDWPGMYVARSKSNRLMIEASSYEYSAQKLSVMLEAKQLCVRLIHANRQIKAQTEVYNNIAQLAAEYEKGFNHGEISILDINKLKIELLNVKQALDQIKVERNSLIEDLVAMNGNEVIEGVENIECYPNQVLEGIDIYEAQYSSKDPDNLYATAVASNSEQNVSLAKMGWFPKFAIGYKYANELGDRFNGVTFGMSLPIFSNKNKVNIAKSEQLVADYNKQNLAVARLSQIKSDYSKAVNLKAQIYAYNNVLSDSNNTEMLKKALDGGQITLLNYLLELRYFLEARQTLLELEFEYQSTLSSLNRYDLL